MLAINDLAPNSEKSRFINENIEDVSKKEKEIFEKLLSSITNLLETEYIYEKSFEIKKNNGQLSRNFSRAELVRQIANAYLDMDDTRNLEKSMSKSVEAIIKNSEMNGYIFNEEDIYSWYDAEFFFETCRQGKRNLYKQANNIEETIEEYLNKIATKKDLFSEDNSSNITDMKEFEIESVNNIFDKESPNKEKVDDIGEFLQSSFELKNTSSNYIEDVLNQYSNLSIKESKKTEKFCNTISSTYKKIYPDGVYLFNQFFLERYLNINIMNKIYNIYQKSGKSMNIPIEMYALGDLPLLDFRLLIVDIFSNIICSGEKEIFLFDEFKHATKKFVITMNRYVLPKVSIIINYIIHYYTHLLNKDNKIVLDIENLRISYNFFNNEKNIIIPKFPCKNKKNYDYNKMYGKLSKCFLNDIREAYGMDRKFLMNGFQSFEAMKEKILFRNILYNTQLDFDKY